uniref:SH3 domain-containing protein n=1 Tax=Knipowitschia caucasica TaxID=637954 RepID=A0AAV2KTY5_KNICA
MSVSTVLAKALFDNAAESPEELAFRKGDILMVLEQEQAGGPGWWLCSLHGRQGIAPANRLRLLQTAATPGSDICCGSSEDSVYLSPGSALARVGVSCSAEDIDGVYRSPLAMGEGRPGELRRTDEDGIGNGKEKSINALNIKEQVLDKPDIISDQVYDTPPSGRWQRTTHSSVSEDDGIYDTPRSVPPHSDSEAEVYDVPTHALAVCTSEVQQTASGPEDSDDGVYSVPSLPGIPLGQEGSCSKILPGEHLHGASEKQASSGDSSEPDCGIYDMPALTVDVLQLSTSSTSTSTPTVSCSPSTLPSRDLATSLAEILSTWKASHCGDPPPPLQQAWARLADLLPALSAIGTAPPSDDLLTLSQVTVTVGSSDGEDDPSNEYAGIGLTPIRPPIHTGDSVGYVKLQGKPDLSPNALAENGHTINAETRMTPSPPLPVSLSLEDSELLAFYSSQSLAHLSCLADAIDVLFSSIQGNQPPRIFVARGKSLIVTAHKLVFIGDTLSRLLSSSDLRTKITTSGGSLCQALKAVVVATKGAAQNYPSLSATQEMVDCVAELSQHAAGFSTLLQRLAEIS